MTLTFARGCFARLDASGADSELIALTKHCLELEPKERPRDASVLAERLTLVTRDAARYRSYFPNVALITPTEPVRA